MEALVQRDELAHESMYRFLQLCERHRGQRGPPDFLVRSRRSQFLIQPYRPFLLKEFVELSAFILLKTRVDSAFDGVQTKQMRGKAMDGSNLAFLQLMQRLCRQVTGGQFVEARTQPELHLIGSLVRKRQRDNVADGQGLR